MTIMPKQIRSSGFTLLEMLVVLLIIGLLAALVGPRLFSQVDKARVDTARVQMKSLQGSLETMRLDIGRFPTTDEGLQMLNRPPLDEKIRPRWRGPYLAEEVPLDPWGNPYQYSIPGRGGKPFALWSFGADGKPGGTDYDADIGDLPP